MPSMQETNPATGGKPRRRSPASKSQMEARRRDAEARARINERKRRTRALIQMGGVMAAWGFSDPGQCEELMRRVVEAKAGPRRLREMGVRVTDRWRP